MDPVQIATGAVGAGALYFVYLVVTKALPAAWTKLKAWWSAGETALSNVRSELTQGTAAIEKRVTALEGDVAGVKKALGTGGNTQGVTVKPATTAGPTTPPTVASTALPPAPAAPAAQ